MGVDRRREAGQRHSRASRARRVYIDLQKRTYLHLGPEQIPLTGAPGQEQTVKAKWRIIEGKSGSRHGKRSTRVFAVESEAPARVRWVLEVIDDPDLAPFAPAVLEMLVGDAAFLRRSGFPFKDLAAFGLPIRAETWTAMVARTCEEKVSTGEVIDPARGGDRGSFA